MNHELTSSEYLEYQENRIKQRRYHRQNKYRNIKTEYRGRFYDSKAEAAYANYLDRLLEAGQIQAWIPQVSLPVTPTSAVRYRADFMVVNNDGTFDFVDVKGLDTPSSKNKRKLIQEHYGLEIQIIKKGTRT